MKTMKIMRTALCFLLVFAFVVEALPISLIGITANAAGLSDDAYMQDATWTDNSPVMDELSPSIVFDDSALDEYVYIPKAERLVASARQTSVLQLVDETTETPSLSDYINAMTPEQKALWDIYWNILSSNISYSSLSDEEIAFLFEYLHVAGTDLAKLESIGLNLSESLEYARIANEYDLNAMYLHESFPDSRDLFAFELQIKIYRNRVNEALYGSATDSMLCEFLLEGYTAGTVLSAYGVSRALDTDMESLLTDKASDEAILQIDSTALADNLSPTDKRNYELLADDLDVRPDTLAEYAEDKELSFREVEELSDNAPVYVSELSTLEPPEISMMSSAGDGDLDPEISIGAPFSYDYNSAEKVNLNTGGVVFETEDYVLPGVNGLDLVIGRRYDSDAANVYTPYGASSSSTTYYYKYDLERWKMWYYEVPGIGTVTGGSEKMYTNEFTTLAQAEAFRRNLPSIELSNVWHPVQDEMVAGGPVIKYVFYYQIILEEVTGSSTSTSRSSKVSHNTYFNDLYGLGQGWSFMFSSVQNGKYLYLADGRSFEINITSTAGDSNLKDYTLTDLRLEKETGGYSNGSASSAYTLYYKDGKKEYFSSNGKLIGIKDKYGNTIKFVHDKLNSQPRITITDTLNRVTTISSSSAVSDSRTVTVALPGSVSLKYTVTTSTSSVTYETITAYTDPIDVVTNYAYTVSGGGFNAWSKNTNGNTNYFMNLTKITHPTGAVSEFVYESVQKNLGSSGLQTCFRLKSRKDNIGTAVYNERMYTYSANNNSGWPANSDPLNLPSAFTYWTTITTPATGLTETHTFNDKHLALSVETKYGTKKVTDRTFDYNANKLPAKITTNTYDYINNSTFSQAIEMAEYDANGNVTASWLPLAVGNTSNTEHKTTYTYNPTYSQLTSVTYKQNAGTTVKKTYTLDSANCHPVTETVTVNAVPAAKTDWAYTAQGNVISEKRYYGNMTTDFVLTEYSYQNNAYLSSIKTGGVKNADGTVVAATPGYAAGTLVTQYEYDNLGRLIKTTDPRGSATTYTYNNKNDLIKVTAPDGAMRQYALNYTANYSIFTNERGTQLKTSFTALGQEYEVVDVSSNTVLSRKTYDSLNRLSTDSDLINNAVTTYAYDHFSRITDSTVKRNSTTLAQETYAYAVTSDGLFKTTKTQTGDANAPSTVKSSYVNNMGFEVKTSVSLGGTEYFDTYIYDYLGNKTQALSALGVSQNRSFTMKWEYDYAGRETRETNTLNQYSARTYDALGRNVTAADYAGSVSTFTYDVLGRLLKQETPFEKAGTTVYNAVKKYDYDQAGNVLREQTQNNVPGAAASWARTDYTYSNRGFLTTADNYNGASAAHKTQYTYDAAGNMLTQKTGTAAANYATTTYAYDRFGNMTGVTDALNQTESYTYDLAGNMRTKTDRNGAVTTYTYDGLGRPLITNVLKSGVTTGTASSTYTLTGQVRTQSNGWGTITNTYDALGRLITQTEPGSVTKTYTYDIGGNNLALTVSASSVNRMNTTYTYDTLNRLETVKENNVLQATYTYDTNGNRKTLAYNAANLTSAYTYNLANQVTKLENKSGTAVRSGYDYTYKLDGNQVSRKDNAGKTTTYTYDDLGRLTKEAESGMVGAITIAYTYDARSNRAGMAVSGAESYTVAYTYDLNNRLTQTSKTEGTTQEISAYAYDKNGNQISKLDETFVASTSVQPAIGFNGSGYELCEYDGFNQLTLANIGGTETKYVYRPDGLRASKTTGSAMTAHVWSGSTMVLDISGTNYTKYVRGINLIASAVNGSALQYFLHNAHGDVVQLANTSGAVTKAYDYDAFGVEKDIAPNDTNPFRYCGEYIDLETNTYYLRARYYNPTTGRFLSEDPIRDGLNWYTYTGNNPILYIDPSGLAMLLGHKYNHLGEPNDYVFYHATATTTKARALEFGMGFIPGYSLGKMLADKLSGNYYYDQFDINVDLQKYKQYKGYLDDVSAVTGTIESFIDLVNSAADVTKGLSKSIGSVFKVVGGIATVADFADLTYEFATNRYHIEKAVQYSGAIRGPMRESIFASKFAEIYMDIMLKDGLVEFQKLDRSHGKGPYTIRWNDEQAKEFYYHFIQNVYDHKRAVIIPENYGKK